MEMECRKSNVGANNIANMKSIIIVCLCLISASAFGQFKPNDLDTNNNPTARNVVTNIAAAESQKVTNNLNSVYDPLGSATAVTNTDFIVKSNSANVLSFTSPQNTFIASNITTTQIITSGGTPTMTTNMANSPKPVGYAGHVGDTVSISGNDFIHHITHVVNGTTTTTSTQATTNSFFVVTFSKTYPTAPKTVIINIGIAGNTTTAMSAPVYKYCGVASTSNYVVSAGGVTIATPSTNGLDCVVFF